MPRIIPTLFLAATLAGPGLPALAESEGALLNGTWLGVGDMLGLLPGHLEVLSIDGENIDSVTWLVPPADCPAGECPLPVPTISGDFAATSFDVTVTADSGAHSPFADLPAGPLMALPGAPWTMFRQEGQMMLTREGQINGANVPLLRIFVAVEPDFPERYFDYLVAMDIEIPRTICGLTMLHANPEDWALFSTLLAEAAPALHAARLEATNGGTAEAPVTAEASAAMERLRGWADGSGELPEGKALLPGLPVPAPADLAAPAQQCLDQVFGA